MAVQIRKLSAEEAAKVFPKRGQMDLSEYAGALSQLQPGDAAEIELGGLSSRALKRRLGQAAKQTGYSLKWARDTGGGALRFQVREARGGGSRARNGRRGRRRRETARYGLRSDRPAHGANRRPEHRPAHGPGGLWPVR